MKQSYKKPIIISVYTVVIVSAILSIMHVPYALHVTLVLVAFSIFILGNFFANAKK